MAKKLLKVASGINLVIGGIVLLISLLLVNSGIGFISALGGFGVIVSAIRLAVGTTFLLVAQKDDNEFIRGRISVLVASIVSILTGHFVTFILGIIAYTDMQGQALPIQKCELTEEEKSQKRLKNLLALGCGLVILAGVIFAMTTWTTLMGVGKTISLICATIVFYGMSYFAEKKFGLKISAITYYILGSAFCLFSFVAAGYFEIFGEWFSLNGNGSNLYQGFLWILAAGLSYLSYLKYENKNLYYVFDISVLASLICILEFFQFGTDITLLILISIFAIFALVPAKNEFVKIASALANILLPLTIFLLFTTISHMTHDDRLIFNLISFGISFIAVYYLAIVNKNLFYQIFAPIITIGIAFMLSINTGTDSKIIFLQLMLITVVVYMIGFYKREQKWLFNATTIIADLALVYILIDSLNLDYNYYAIASGIALLGTSLMVSISKNFGKTHFEIILEPIKVILLAYTIYRLAYRFDYVESGLFIGITAFVFALICVFRSELMKKIYFIGATIAAILAVVVNVGQFAPVVHCIVTIALAILLFITFKAKDEHFAYCKEFIYVLFLLSLSLVSINTFDHFKLKLLGIILLTIAYTILLVAYKRNDILRCITIIALLIPYVAILPISIWNDNVNYILYTLPWLALIFVYTRGFLSSANLKLINGIEMATLAIWYLAVTSHISLEVAIFVGITSFVGILIGYKSDKWISLYYTGIVFLILNTIIQLKEFWTSIPIWAYILVAGLILIGLVTYKEYTKSYKKDDDEKIEAEIVNQSAIEVPKKELDSRSVITGSVLYAVIIPIILQIIMY